MLEQQAKRKHSLINMINMIVKKQITTLTFGFHLTFRVCIKEHKIARK